MKIIFFAVLILITSCSHVLDDSCPYTGMTKKELIEKCGMYSERTFFGSEEYLFYNRSFPNMFRRTIAVKDGIVIGAM